MYFKAVSWWRCAGQSQVLYFEDFHGENPLNASTSACQWQMCKNLAPFCATPGCFSTHTADFQPLPCCVEQNHVQWTLLGLLSASYSAATCMETQSDAKKEQLQKKSCRFPSLQWGNPGICWSSFNSRCISSLVVWGFVSLWSLEHLL